MVKARWTGPFPRFGLAVHPGWARLGVAAVATLVLATSFGFMAELVAGRPADSTLRLNSVSAAQLDQLGIKLVATRPPPYCALSNAVNDRGWAQRGLAGCPISRRMAEKDATAGGSLAVIESALARASMPQNESVGRNHLVWVLVVQNNGPGIAAAAACPVVSGSPVCFGRGLGGPRLLLLDGQTGAMLYATWAGGFRAGGMLPRPVPTAFPPTLPARAISAPG